MGRLKDVVPAGIDQVLLGLRIPAPEDEHESLLLPGKLPDHRIGEVLPALVLV